MQKIPPVFPFKDTEADDPVSRAKCLANEEHFARHVKLRMAIDADPAEQVKFMNRLKEEHQEAVIEGFLEGWWDLDENGNMAALPQKFKISDFPENAQMAHVIAAAGLFPSVSQARKNGWDKPLVAGEFVVTKKKIRIIVLDQ